MLFRSIICFAFVVGFLPIPTLSQDNSNLWLRVFTNEDSMIEVNRLSLVLEQDRIISAEFRTIHLNPEPIPGESGLKFKTRVDSIHFNVGDRTYRISESKFLNAAGNIELSASSNDATTWKPFTGRTAIRLFSAAGQLRPFGFWKVQSYRYSSGEPASVEDPRALRALVGSEFLISLDRVAAGNETCYSPIFTAKTITDEEFAKSVGSSLRSLGLPWDKLEVIVLTCNTKGNFPPQTLILRPPDDSILMLWEGVFLHMERTTNIFSP